MALEAALAFALFCFVASVTPGPNNLMLLSSGLTYGFRRTVPHLAGVVVGFAVLLCVVGLGFGPVFERFPALAAGLKLVGAFFMLWLAWQIARAGPVEEGGAAGRPLTFLQAAAFQGVNPKAWATVLGAIAAYLEPTAPVLSTLSMVAIYGATGAPACVIWVVFGLFMKRLIAEPRTVRMLNRIMAVLLVLSLVPMLA